MTDIQKLLSEVDREQVLAVIQKAADAIMEVYREGDFTVDKKADDSPVTQADKISHDILDAELPKINPEYTVLSEEGENRDSAETYWMVDPLDGTSDFMKKNDQFAVMVALMHKEKPVYGVVHAPAKQEIYVGGEVMGGSFKIVDGSLQKISVAAEQRDPILVAASLSHRHPKTDEYLEDIGNYELMPIGSGLKFCYVADGTIDMYVRFQGSMEWDTAAPQAILESAGGVIEWEDKDMRYGKPDRLNKGFICKSA